MANIQTWMRRETDRLLSIAIMRKVHPSGEKATHHLSARLGPVPNERHLPSVRIDKTRITLPRCCGTGSGDWRKQGDD
jgi:hypothetical protein